MFLHFYGPFKRRMRLFTQLIKAQPILVVYWRLTYWIVGGAANIIAPDERSELCLRGLNFFIQ